TRAWTMASTSARPSRVSSRSRRPRTAGSCSSAIELAEGEPGHADGNVGAFFRGDATRTAGLDLRLACRVDRRLARELHARAGQVDLHPFFRVELRELQGIGVDDDVVVDARGVDREPGVGLLADSRAHRAGSLA